MSSNALIVYHKNIGSIYPKEWIERFKNSILNQSCKDFDIIELNYGGTEERIFDNSIFISRQFPTFVDGMNYLIDKCFFDDKYLNVFNSNVDDWYSPFRIEKQLLAIKRGYHIVSSNFSLINDKGVEYKRHAFHRLALAYELRKGHNIIAHPVVAYTKEAWMKGHRYIPSEIPLEDLKMWQRMIKDCRITILSDCLLFHRVHDNSVCQNPNNR